MKQILENYRQYVCLPPDCVPRGDLLYIISSIFRLLTVTHVQGLMSLKINTLFFCESSTIVVQLVTLNLPEPLKEVLRP